MCSASFRHRLSILLIFTSIAWSVRSVDAADSIQLGVAEADITPAIDQGKPVWIAGYGQNRPAKGIHDPIMVRAMVFFDGKRTIAMAVADLVGLQYDAVQRIREQLNDLDYVMVASTHNHEGPDVLGLWGPSPLRSGVDPEYITMVVERTVETIRQARQNLVPVTAVYGTAQDDTLLRDSRLPHVPDGILRAIQFKRVDNGMNHAVIVGWSNHPETMGSRNQQITADFPHATVGMLKQHYQCPVVYFTSACGGLMTNPRNRIHDSQGNELHEGDFEYCRIYGEEVGRLAISALEEAQPLDMSPIAFAAKPVSIPMENRVYQMGKIIGILNRDAFTWTGDFNQRGALISGKNVASLSALETEVSYLRMGQLSVVGIPGEIYPELVYGDYQEPVEPNVDFPDAPLEKSVIELIPDKNFLLIGLANDEIGYIIPLRQWDEQSPYAYGQPKGQYGEGNSVGKQAAPILMQALEQRVQEVTADADR